MSAHYKENNFSTENLATTPAAQNNTTKTNVDHLIKRIIVEKRRDTKITITLILTSLSVLLIFIFLQN